MADDIADEIRQIADTLALIAKILLAAGTQAANAERTLRSRAASLDPAGRPRQLLDKLP